ncbi:MAG: dimethylmenaquinone methyltransferase, partial [Hyphomicrobiales bacterium]|nr:dimethylmenaquinone methyltransferase [Hyphomicrobiales bacterium]
MAVDSLIARLRALDICDLSDAVDALGLPPAVTGLAPAWPTRPIAGRAVTVKLIAGNAPPGGPPRHLCTGAIEAAGPDNVIVIEQRSGIDAAAWGGL